MFKKILHELYVTYNEADGRVVVKKVIITFMIMEFIMYLICSHSGLSYFNLTLAGIIFFAYNFALASFLALLNIRKREKDNKSTIRA